MRAVACYGTRSRLKGTHKGDAGIIGALALAESALSESGAAQVYEAASGTQASGSTDASSSEWLGTLSTLAIGVAAGIIIAKL